MDKPKWGRVILSQFQMRGTNLSQLSGSFPVLDPGRPFSPEQTRTTSPPVMPKPGIMGLRPEQQGQGAWVSQQGWGACWGGEKSRAVISKHRPASPPWKLFQQRWYF